MKAPTDTKKAPARKADAGAGGPLPSRGVRVVNLNRSYRDVKAVDDVTFEVPPGSVCTLLGPSGSGKTTTLRVLAGLDRPDSGEVWIGDQAMVRGRTVVPAEKRGIGLVFQAYALWPHMKIGDQIAYSLKVRHTDKATIEAAVTESARMVGISTLLDRYPSQLSGGQQQRVALARALVFNPQLLLLDEPLSNLDAALRRQTRRELETLQRRLKVTTIYVTHDQEEAMAVSDMVVVMSQGKVDCIGPPREIYDNPPTLYAAAFVGASNLLPGKVVGTDGKLATVRLGDGSVLTGRAGPDLAEGDDATLAVKPVDVAVEPAGSTRAGTIAAQLKAATFVGPTVELDLVVAEHDFRLPIPRRDADFGDGSVRLYVDPNTATVLKGLP
jgi:ABC-type Fe3+/spermidine/putrescine transport system ATPase subunit